MIFTLAGENWGTGNYNCRVDKRSASTIIGYRHQPPYSNQVPTDFADNLYCRTNHTAIASGFTI